jgi:hypothetical protein
MLATAIYRYAHGTKRQEPAGLNGREYIFLLPTVTNVNISRTVRACERMDTFCTAFRGRQCYSQKGTALYVIAFGLFSERNFKKR